jgi:hypothetical protein
MSGAAHPIRLARVGEPALPRRNHERPAERLGGMRLK